MNRVVVVMGVSGSGKSTVSAALAEALCGIYVDADDLHSSENVAHMAAGKPLTDEMRWPWLDRCIAEVNRLRVEAPAVIACSALRQIYRDHLRAGINGVRFVYLDAERDLVLERMSKRKGHYMPLSLLDSQFATLEIPQAEDGVVAVSVNQTVEGIVSDALNQLQLRLS